MLHKDSKNYYDAIRLVFTQRSIKQHNLSKLPASVIRHSEELAQIFPRNNAEEKLLFELLKVAYTEARYNPDFLITKEDIDTLLSKVELLHDITKRICEQKNKEYGERE